MSLSNLEAQLAALTNNNNKHGSTVSSNKRHAEAQGRGLHFSVATGGTHQIESVRSVPSLIYATAQEAADVPLSHLQQKYKMAVERLQPLYPSLKVLPDNGNNPGVLPEYLVLIGSILMECESNNNNPVYESGVDVLEYLLRHYQLHRTQELHTFWMLAALDQFPFLLRRYLQLVDWAIHPSYLWLRPYCGTSTGGDLNNNLPSRSVMAKHVMHNVDVLRQVLSFTKHAAHWNGRDASRLGTKRLLSFSAALLLEGLQSSLLPNDPQAVLRTLLPYLHLANASREDNDFRAWGLVLSCAVSEVMNLSSATANKLCDSILECQADVDGMACVLALLQQTPATEAELLALWQPDGSDETLLGCSLNSRTNSKIIEAYPDVPSVLGNLYNHRRLVVAPFLASFLLYNLSDTRLVVALVQQPDLYEVWKDPRIHLVASLAHHVVSRDVSNARDLLLSLHQLDCVATEQGLARAMEKIDDKKRLDGLLDIKDGLPPRIAMDDSDDSVRLKAISNLSNMDNSLFEKLLQCSSDTNMEIQDAAVDKLRAVLKSGFVPSHEMAGLALSAAMKSSEFMHVLGIVVGVSASAKTWQAAVQYIASKLRHEDAQIDAVKALHFAFGVDKSRPTLQAAKKLLLDSVVFRAGLSAWNDTTRDGQRTWSQAVVVFLDALKKHKTACDSMELCVRLLRLSTHELSVADCEVVEGYLQTALGQITSKNPIQVPVVLISLASIESNRLWSRSTLPAVRKMIHKVRDGNRKPASPIQVLMEAVCRANVPNKAVERLLHVLQDALSEAKDHYHAVVPLLCLLGVAEQSVRNQVMKLWGYLTTSFAASANERESEKLTGLVHLCKSVTSKQNSKQLGGIAILSSILSECIRRSSDPQKTRQTLLTLCWCTASCATTIDANSEESWLDPGSVVGGSHATTVVLEAMELSGEENFPLLSRWEWCGSRLLQGLMFAQGSLNDKSVITLVHNVSRMMKGVTISDHRVVISSGPEALGRGGRARSYSVGKFDGCALLDPYPEDMTKAIVDLFSGSIDGGGASLVASCMITDVLQSQSWREGIFVNLSDMSRRNLVSSLLLFIERGATNKAEDAFFDLPLTASDVASLVNGVTKKGELTQESLMIDFVLTNTTSFSGPEDVEGLLSLLFNRIEVHCTNHEPEDLDGSAFVIQSALHAARKLLDGSPRCEVGTRKLTKWTKALLTLVGVDGQLNAAFGRSGPAALSVLLSLCEQFPGEVSSSLIPAMLSSVAPGKDSRSSQVFTRVLPVYLKHSDGVLGLITSFVGAVAAKADGDDRLRLYEELIRAASCPDVPPSKQRVFLGSLLALFLAGKTSQSGQDLAVDGDISFAVDVIAEAPVSMQLDSLELLVSCANGLVALSCDENSPDIENVVGPLSAAVGLCAAFGLDAGSEKKPLRLTQKSVALTQAAMAIVRVVCDSLVIEDVRDTIQSGNESATKASLRLWQELLVLQSAANTFFAEKGASSESQVIGDFVNFVNAACLSVQELLPIHVFLASAASLVQDGGTVEVRSRALRLISDRTATLIPGSHESTLFLDVVPMVVDIIRNYSGAEGESTIVLVQSALVAVEQIARSLSGTEVTGRKGPHTKIFLGALELCTSLLVGDESDTEQEFDFKKEKSSLFSSAALCAATLTRVIGPTCLYLLSKLMRPLIRLLKQANAAVQSTGDFAETEIQVTQLAILRVLVAMVERVPQFIPPYLPSLLNEEALLSHSIRNTRVDDKVPVGEAIKLLDEKLASHVPPRMLIPSLAKSFPKQKSPESRLVILLLLKNAADQATSTIVSGHKDALLRCITKAFLSDGSSELRESLTNRACDLFDAVVLKLSEVQLNQAFAFLIDWRDKESASEDKNERKKFSFWSICSRLSRELRTIFLPCLSLVVDDLLSELKTAVAGLKSENAHALKLEDGSKKRKIDSTFGPGSLRTLRVVLLTLEHALRADAFQGGTWVRADENERYEDFLQPLGKLLLSHVSPSISDAVGEEFAYSSLVAGTGDGSVVACLTALASAGGNEQLWKPLNHAVLQACGDESRSEVRRAGLVCLLELMRSLGEEYMVLLPENLPVLAELLEDTSEEVANLTREVVALAEELTGESLEESLR